VRLSEVLTDESEMEADDVSPRRSEASGCQPLMHSIRINRRKDVVRMRCTHRLEVQGVLPHEDAAGAQDPMQLGKQAVLIFGRRHVVKDREARCRGKAIVRQSCVSCIGDDDVDVRSGQTVSQGFAQ